MVDYEATCGHIPNFYTRSSERYLLGVLRDALARRLRHAAPEAGQRIVVVEADIALFEAIDRHGPLPTGYLHEFARHRRCDYSNTQHRLTKLYHGDASGPLLTRPTQQFASFEAQYQHLVYDLAPRARRLLAARCGGEDHPARSDPFVHRLMCACVGASFELLAGDHGLRYIGLSEMLSRGAAASARSSPRPLALPTPQGKGHEIVPDLLFGLEYPEVGYRFFAVECDRNTESIERRDLSQSAISRKLSGYADALTLKAYRERWGIPNLHVLTVTTNATHAKNILTAISRRVLPVHQPRFGVLCLPAFGANWRVPNQLLSCTGWKGLAQEEPNSPSLQYDLGICSERIQEFSLAQAYYRQAQVLFRDGKREVAASIARATQLGDALSQVEQQLASRRAVKATPASPPYKQKRNSGSR